MDDEETKSVGGDQFEDAFKDYTALSPLRESTSRSFASSIKIDIEIINEALSKNDVLFFDTNKGLTNDLLAMN